MTGHTSSNTDYVPYEPIDSPRFNKTTIVKKEFYKHRQTELTDEQIDKIINAKSSDEFKLRSHQMLLGNFLGPNTIYNNMLVMHGTGTGKTMTAIAVAESHQSSLDIINESGTPAYIYVISNDEARNRFIDDLLLKYSNKSYISLDERKRYKYLTKQVAIQPSLEPQLSDLRRVLKSRLKQSGYYRFMGPRKFQNLTLGTRIRTNKSIIDADKTDEQLDKKYAKDPDVTKFENLYFRQSNSESTIKNLNNCIVIVDEAHDITDNDAGRALRFVLNRSKDYTLMLLTATPMKNRPDEIVELLNFMLSKSRKLSVKDLFTKHSHNTGYVLKSNASDTLIKRSQGLVSFVRSGNPSLFPRTVDHGVKLSYPKDSKLPKNLVGLKHTKLVPVKLTKNQMSLYNLIFQDELVVPRESARFIFDMVFPGPGYGKQKSNLKDNQKGGKSSKSNGSKKSKKTKSKHTFAFKPRDIAALKYQPKDWLKKNGIEFVKDTMSTKSDALQITGSILEYKNIGNWSGKYKTILEILNGAVNDNRGLCFIYNSLVESVGIKLIRQLLLRNGYVDFSPSNSPNAKHLKHVKCYYCGIEQHKHPKSIKTHEYAPAQFITIFGTIDMKKRQRLISTFTSPENRYGSQIKIILGSSVMKQAVDLKNIRNSIITGYQEDFSTIRQIIGRSVRQLSHKDLPESERFVNNYVLCSVIPDKNICSAEAFQFIKQESTHVVIKAIERSLKISAFDCSLNKAQNVFPKHDTDKSVDCDYDTCDYKCAIDASNKELMLKQLDTSTYESGFHRQEIDDIKYAIKQCFAKYPAFTIDTIEYYIRQMIPDQELIDTKYIYIALDELLNSTIKQKFTNSQGLTGYLVYRHKYYVFQPETQPLDISIQSRVTPQVPRTNVTMSISNWLQDNKKTGNQPIDSKGLYKKLLKRNSQESVSRLLGRQQQAVQISVLETEITKYIKANVKRSIKLKSKESRLNKFVLGHYKNYLITKETIKPTTKRDYTQSLSVSGSLDSKQSHRLLSGLIGHLLGNKPRRYNFDRQEFETFYADQDDDKSGSNAVKYKEAKIVGFIDRMRSGNFVFKLRPGLDRTRGVSQEDKRFLHRGFICNQSSQKDEIIKIADQLGIDYTTDVSSKQNRKNQSKVKLSKLCKNIELELRRLQTKANKRPDNNGYYTRWFYDYLDL
jgi:hypothetical protein